MRRAAVIGTACLAALLLLAVPAAATEFVVNTVNDPGTGVCDAAECTFREAVTAANTGGVRDDTITFTVTGFISAIGAPFPAVISAATQGKLTITGPGADVLGAPPQHRELRDPHQPHRGRHARRGPDDHRGRHERGRRWRHPQRRHAGGRSRRGPRQQLERRRGLSNDVGASLTVRRSLVADNTVNPNYRGAGIYIERHSGRRPLDDHRQPDARHDQLRPGPGHLRRGPDDVDHRQHDRRERGPQSPANIFVSGGAVTLGSSIVADPIQLPSGTAANCAANVPITSAGYNLSDDGSCGLSATGDKPGIEPQLGALADNGGPTETLAIPVRAAPPSMRGGSSVPPPTISAACRVPPTSLGSRTSLMARTSAPSSCRYHHRRRRRAGEANRRRRAAVSARRASSGPMEPTSSSGPPAMT